MIHAGWGKTIGGGPGADILKQAMLPVADHNHCSVANSGISPPVDEQTMVCAGGQGESGCQVYVKEKWSTIKIYRSLCSYKPLRSTHTRGLDAGTCCRN